jgi:hypothetical protein
MPLLPGASKSVIGENIRTERNAGRPEAQAIAIAFHNAHKGRSKGKKKAAAAPGMAKEPAQPLVRPPAPMSPLPPAAPTFTGAPSLPGLGLPPQS